jgi:hypothetical protein
MTTPRRRHSPLLSLSIVLCLTGSAACTSASPGGTPVNLLEQLQARPRTTAAVATYTEMEAKIRAAITTASPATVWTPRRERRESFCSSPFDNTDGRTVLLPSFGAAVPIADNTWSVVLTATEAIARNYGLTITESVANTPGNYQVRYSNPTDGAYVDIGSAKATFVTTNTGCHLPD